MPLLSVINPPPPSCTPLQVRIMFEVQDLKYATLATVSRCGMVWFSEDVLSTDMIFFNFLDRLRSIPLDEGEDEALRKHKSTEDEGDEAASPMLQVHQHLRLLSISTPGSLLFLVPFHLGERDGVIVYRPFPFAVVCFQTLNRPVFQTCLEACHVYH